MTQQVTYGCHTLGQPLSHLATRLEEEWSVIAMINLSGLSQVMKNVEKQFLQNTLPQERYCITSEWTIQRPRITTLPDVWYLVLSRLKMGTSVFIGSKVFHCQRIPRRDTQSA